MLTSSFSPGLLTIGPSLEINGYSTWLSNSGFRGTHFVLSIWRAFCTGHSRHNHRIRLPQFALRSRYVPFNPLNRGPSLLLWRTGKSSNDIGPGVEWADRDQGFSMRAGYNVDMGGDIAIHVVPQVTFGVQILGGQLLDAEAFVRADTYAGLSINGSVSRAVALEFCWDLCKSKMEMTCLMLTRSTDYGVEVDGGLTGRCVRVFARCEYL